MKHGVDLFRRDSVVLGRLVTALGTFAECCEGAPQVAVWTAFSAPCERCVMLYAYFDLELQTSTLQAYSTSY